MAEPITLDQAKAHLRVDGDDDNELISAAIVDARGWVENYTGLILTRRTVREILPRFSSRLRSWPIVSIDAVAYVDQAGGAQLLSAGSYVPQIAARPASLLGSSWPSVLRGSRVQVELTAGFETAAEITGFAPVLMRAMKLLLTGFYEDREAGGLTAETEEAAKDLCRNWKDWRV